MTAMPSGRHHRPSVRPRSGAVGARRLVVGAAVALAGVALLGAPGSAQLPTLPPLFTTTTSTTRPSSSTTTSTVLLPIEEVLKPTPTAPGSTTPGADTTAPPSSVLPLPTPPPTRKTTAFKPTPVPPSTPAKALSGPAKTPRTTAPPSRSSASADDTEAGEGDEGFLAELPLPSDGEFVTADDDTTMELGIEAVERDQVRPFASVAAALLALILLRIALILRSEVRKRPAYAGGGDYRRRSTDLYDWTYDEDQ